MMKHHPKALVKVLVVEPIGIEVQRWRRITAHRANLEVSNNLEEAVVALEGRAFDAIVFSGRAGDDPVTLKDLVAAIAAAQARGKVPMLFFSDGDPLFRRLISQMGNYGLLGVTMMMADKRTFPDLVISLPGVRAG